MKACCVKSKKDTEKQKIIDQLCNQNVLFVKLKSQDL